MIILECESGLTSRIITMSQAYQLAKKYNTRLVILWKGEEACCCRYSDLFSKKQFGDIACTAINISLLRKSETTFFENLKQLFIIGGGGNNQLVTCFNGVVVSLKDILFDLIRRFYSNKNMIFRYTTKSAEEGKTEDIFSDVCNALKNRKSVYIRAYCGITKTLQFSLEGISYKENIDNHINQLLPRNSNIIGVHIRRGDMNAKTYIDVQKYLDKMHEYVEQDKNIKFYLATDNEQIKEQICDNFENRIIFQKDLIYSTKTDLFANRKSTEGIIGGLIDAMCLARTKKIIGSKGSVFSSFASRVGDIKLVFPE